MTLKMDCPEKRTQPDPQIGMPRVLLLSLVFAPDGVSTANIVSQLAGQLHGLGHEVSVFTTTPHYNHDADALAAQPLLPKWGNLLLRSEFRGVPVYHARVRAKGKRVLGRVLDYLRFHVVSTLAGLRLGGAFEVVLAPSPPLTIGLSAAILASLRRVPFVYNVQEIYPDVAVSLGVLRHRPMIRTLEWLERFIYSRAEAVVVISEGFRQQLLAKGVPDEKLHVIPNFADVESVQPGERHNSFSLQHHLDEKFVVLYAGNLGLTQDFDTVIAAAERLAGLPEVCFLIVGDGARRNWLVTRTQELQLPNMLLLPYQPHGSVPLMYAACDVGMVPMQKGTALDTFPSKIYTIMAAGRPAIVSAEPDAELSRVVAQAGCGFSVTPGDPVALANAIRSACEDRSKMNEMGQRGRRYVVAHHSPEVVALQYHRLLVRICDRKDAGD